MCIEVGGSLEVNRITVVGGEGSRRQRASVTVAYIGELRQLTKGLASYFRMGTSIQVGIENLT